MWLTSLMESCVALYHITSLGFGEKGDYSNFNHIRLEIGATVHGLEHQLGWTLMLPGGDWRNPLNGK